MSRREPAASPFRDLSNLRTPRPNRKPASSALVPTPLQGPTPTPLCRRRSVADSGAPKLTPLDRRLRALQVDQSHSARRAESGRERALRTFAASASSWLSLLLRDPAACGCSLATGSAAAQPRAAGKRDSLDGERARGRSPKRRRGGDRGAERRKGMTPAMASALKDSLREACSLDDVTERMGRYMSKDACEDVLVMMCQICKNIDEGRLKMKADCPLVTDLRLKQKATRIFMCYNPQWLRIGLHIVLGGDSLLQNGSEKRDKEIPFLKLILDKQMFAAFLKAKSFADKNVARALRKQGYNEALGNIILKRIFLLVAALDRAKVESALPLENGIDSLDGGSPLLFCHHDQIKSSRQIIQESLGEVMHGEGDLVMHLTTMGYRLSYQQPALSEYDFTIRSLFEDIQDGIILCRVIQLLLSDASIVLKVIAPSDTHKKKFHNCTMVIESIKQAGVPLCDTDGVTISAEDIATGDKELILSLLWNMFIHMQIPLLANKTSLACELSRLQQPVTEKLMPEHKSHIHLLYDWVKAVCSKYGISFESTSQFERSTLSCIISYYLNIDAFPLKETLTGCQKELFACHELDTISGVTRCPYSKIGKVMTDFLQDIPASGMLADDVLFDERSAIFLLAFLSSHLTDEKRLGQLKSLITTRFHYQNPEIKISARRSSRGKNDMKYQSPQIESADESCTNQDWVATIVQTQASHQLCEVETSKGISAPKDVFDDDMDCGNGISSRVFAQHEEPISTLTDFPMFNEVLAAKRIQSACRRLLYKRNIMVTAAIKIQNHWRGLSVRKCFTRQVHAIIAIQTSVRLFLCHRNFQQQRLAAKLIQRVVRGWLTRKRMLGSSSLRSYIILCVLGQSQHKKCHQSLELKIVLDSVISMQSFVRGWLARKQTRWRKDLFLETRKRAVIIIQAHFRGWIARQAAARKRMRITTIQSYFKAYLVRKASKQEIARIRSRLQKSSAQVDDGMRLINRLVAALSQLVHQQSLSSIRQTCATLSTATEYSKKCCETLVTAGAADILLKQIHLLNRGIADQEVLKQVLLTLRNIARYSNLRTVLLNTPRTVEIVFQELLRNKSDGFFIASDILKKLCESNEGRETARVLHLYIKRLRNLLQDLENKVELDKRNGRTGAAKETNLRRLGEAATLYHLLDH